MQTQKKNRIFVRVKKSLFCMYTLLTTLDMSGNTALTTLYCNSSRLTNLNVSGNTALTDLNCCCNQLVTLNVSHCTALSDLGCSGNQLENLDVRDCTELTGLNCYDNQLTTLDLSKNIVLSGLCCNDNQLTTLDMSANTELIGMDCSNNQLTTSALNDFFRTLHNNPLTGADDWPKSIYIKNNPGTSNCDVRIAEEKGWWVYTGELPISKQRLSNPKSNDFDGRIFWKQWHAVPKGIEDSVEMYMDFIKQF